MNKKFYIETYGCQMNKAESEAISIILYESNWKATQDASEADIIIINTCSVRKTAEDRVWGRIGALKGYKSNKVKLILMGCMAERLKEEIFKREPSIDLVVCNNDKKKLPQILGNFKNKKSHTLSNEEKEYKFLELHENTGFKSFLPIMHGCDNFCTYCIVPYVRGREVSRSPDSIFQEIQELKQKGIKEITLLGQNVNSYTSMQNGNKINFTDLLRLIIDRIGDSGWIRFLTSHPKDFPLELIDVIQSSQAICKHIHLPVQHGSNYILEKMNRKYTREAYLAIIQNLRSAIPNVSITTDILIGFPGESDKDFQQIISLMEEVQFNDAFMYRYNQIEGTKAFSMDQQIAEDIKLKRLNDVIQLQRKIVQKKKKDKINQVVDVLIEGVSKQDEKELLARSEFDDMIIFPGNKTDIGTMKRIRITGLKGNTLYGEVLL